MKPTPVESGAESKIPASSAAHSTPAAASAPEVRERIEEALRLDLVGPGAGPADCGAGVTEELLPRRVRPSNWYLTGFLVPDQTPPDERADPDEDDDSTGEVAEKAGLAEESADEHRAAKRGFFPSSIGLSFLAAEAARELQVTVSWGDYTAEEIPPAKPGGDARPVWRRTPRREQINVPLGPTADERIPVPDARGLELHRVERALAPGDSGSAVPDATRAVSLFLVNRRPPAPDRSTDAFQTEIEAHCDAGFLGRPETRGGRPGAWDEEVADLHYRDTLAFATGHGVSADWDLVDGNCRVVRTAWIPRAEVERIDTADIPGVELSMAALAGIETGNQARDRLRPLISRYRDWIAARRSGLDALSAGQRETAEERLTAADAVRLLFRRIVADQAFPLELKVPNTASRRAIAEVEAIAQGDEVRYPPNRPPAPGDVSWAAYWQALQECHAWWKRGPADFSVFPPGKSWVGVIRRLRPSLSHDWSNFTDAQQKRLLGVAPRRDEDWALLGNMFGFAIKPVFGDPTILREVETIVKGVIATSDDAFLPTADAAYTRLTAFPGLGRAIATRLLTLARPDRCVSWNGASSTGLAAYSNPAQTARPDLTPYGRLLRDIYKCAWFSDRPNHFGDSREKEAWSMRVALLDAFIYCPKTP